MMYNRSLELILKKCNFIPVMQQFPMFPALQSLENTIVSVFVSLTILDDSQLE